MVVAVAALPALPASVAVMARTIPSTALCRALIFRFHSLDLLNLRRGRLRRNWWTNRPVSYPFAESRQCSSRRSRTLSFIYDSPIAPIGCRVPPILGDWTHSYEYGTCDPYCQAWRPAVATVGERCDVAAQL